LPQPAFALEYAIREIHINQIRLKLIVTYQRLAAADYDDDVNLLRDNMDTTCIKNSLNKLN
jgi:hypothetical protein